MSTSIHSKRSSSPPRSRSRSSSKRAGNPDSASQTVNRDKHRGRPPSSRFPSSGVSSTIPNCSPQSSLAEARACRTLNHCLSICWTRQKKSKCIQTRPEKKFILFQISFWETICAHLLWFPRWSFLKAFRIALLRCSTTIAWHSTCWNRAALSSLQAPPWLTETWSFEWIDWSSDRDIKSCGLKSIRLWCQHRCKSTAEACIASGSRRLSWSKTRAQTHPRSGMKISRMWLCALAWRIFILGICRSEFQSPKFWGLQTSTR